MRHLLILFVATIHCCAVCADDSDSQILRSIPEVRLEQSRDEQSEAPFEIEASLGFISPTIGQINVQDNQHALIVDYISDDHPTLGDLRPGARLKITGALHQNSRIVSADQITVVSEFGTLNPIVLGPDTKRSQVRLNLYSRTEGVVRQIFKRRDKTFLSLDVGKMRVDAVVFQETKTSELLPLLGKTISVEGTTRLPNRETAVFMLTRFDQISPSSMNDGLTSPSEDITLQPQEFHVLFSDHDQMVLGTGAESDELWQLSTRFAKQLNSKQVLSAYTERRGGDQTFIPPVRGRRSLLLEVVGSKPQSPVATLLQPDEIRSKDLPTRVKVSGTIRTVIQCEKTCEFDLQTDGPDVRVIIAHLKTTETQNIAIGDYAEFSGLFLQRKKTDGDSGRLRSSRTEPVMYVASMTDVLVTKQSVQIDEDLLGFIICIVAVTLLASFVWARSLRHQVSLRTESLNAVTSHLATSFEAAREAILLNDQNRRVSRVNDRFADVFGFTPAEGSSVEDCLKRASSAFTNPEYFDSYVHTMLEKDGNQSSIELDTPKRRIHIYSSPIRDSNDRYLGDFWSFEDITERRNLELELLQAQKMEAVGQLSGGIAHDFNNLLTVIANNVSLIVYESEKQAGKLEAFATPINTAIDQAAELTQQLLDFSRKSRLNARCVDANKLVERVYSLARRTLDSTIQLSFVEDASTLLIDVDVTRIEQVIINLCINARDSIVDGHGSIWLRTRAEDHPRIGDAICIEVEDDGHGMLPETRRRVFEPFFTTKERGQGTGLGLSTAFGVVQQHGGEISCTSEWEEGTTFQVWFPRSTQTAQLPEPPSVRRITRQRSLRLLLVDDDEQLRVSGGQILRKLGHTVELACNGHEAIERLAKNPNFDAILLDLTMPQMTGNEAYEIIRNRWPELPVAICSGYSADRIATPDDDQNSLAFLPKPFQVEDLQQTLISLTK